MGDTGYGLSSLRAPALQVSKRTPCMMQPRPCCAACMPRTWGADCAHSVGLGAPKPKPLAIDQMAMVPGLFTPLLQVRLLPHNLVAIPLIMRPLMARTLAVLRVSAWHTFSDLPCSVRGSRAWDRVHLMTNCSPFQRVCGCGVHTAESTLGAGS